MNPLNYIGKNNYADGAQYLRIRVGAFDAGTSLTISMTLALKLAASEKDVDYALVWDKPHCDATIRGKCATG